MNEPAMLSIDKLQGQARFYYTASNKCNVPPRVPFVVASPIYSHAGQ
jgi:hypothetical protein